MPQDFDPMIIGQVEIVNVFVKTYATPERLFVKDHNLTAIKASVEVPNREIRRGEQPFLQWRKVQFFDRLWLVVHIGEAEITLASSPVNFSPMYFSSKFVLRPEELRRLDEGDADGKKRSPMGKTYYRDYAEQGYRFALDTEIRDDSLYACNTEYIYPKDEVANF